MFGSIIAAFVVGMAIGGVGVAMFAGKAVAQARFDLVSWKERHRQAKEALLNVSDERDILVRRLKVLSPIIDLGHRRQTALEKHNQTKKAARAKAAA